MSVASIWDRRLERDGLGSLDYDDGAGGIKVGNRGSGKLLDEARAFGRERAAEEVQRRQSLLSERRLMSQAEARVYALYATGLGQRRIAKRLKMGRGQVYRIVKGFEVAERPEATLHELVTACDPATLVLFFALLERALTAPAEVQALVSTARAVPEIRQLLEPDEVCDG